MSILCSCEPFGEAKQWPESFSQSSRDEKVSLSVKLLQARWRMDWDVTEGQSGGSTRLTTEGSP